MKLSEVIFLPVEVLSNERDPDYLRIAVENIGG